VHPTHSLRSVQADGSRRVFRQFAWLEVGSVKMALSRPTHPQVTPAVGQCHSAMNYFGGKVSLHRWMYPDGHPNRLAKVLNRGSAILHSLGIYPNYFVTLEVVGRKSGTVISFPLAMTVMNGGRYLVSMLGWETNWVRNVKAAEGKARLRHGTSEQVLLKEVDARQSAPILKKYLQIAPGARPHIPINKDAPIAEFEKIASEYPVFRVEKIK
jgi:hypothetical protein